MIAEILSTGNEVLSGAVVDSNAAYIAEKLEDEGINVVRHSCVGDDIDMISQVIGEISTRSDIAIVTGGLGPTSDDITAEAAAKTAKVEMVLYPEALAAIEEFFRLKNRTMSPSNKKQAILPKGSKILFNAVGTAPGFEIQINRCRFYFLPGVPSEMKYMFQHQALPAIREYARRDKMYYQIKTISTFGYPESVAGERVAEVCRLFPGIRLGLRAVFPIIQVKLYARGTQDSELSHLMDQAVQWCVCQLGNKVFSTDGSSMEMVIGQLLRDQKATLAVAESCTGGLISHLITNVSGSSDYFLFSAVTYANDMKINTLGVSVDTIRQYGAVHEETVKEMANGVRKIAGSTYGLATSGIAGPTGGTDDKPVGTLCIGISTPQQTYTWRYQLSFGDREKNKALFAITALDRLRRIILQMDT